MKWTPVKHMPNEGTKVLLWVGDKIVTGYRGRHWAGGFGTGHQAGHCITGATHWSPFPNVPRKPLQTVHGQETK